MRLLVIASKARGSITLVFALALGFVVAAGSTAGVSSVSASPSHSTSAWWEQRQSRVRASRLVMSGSWSGSGHLNQGEAALYDVYVPWGEYLRATLSGPAGTDFDLLFGGPLPDGPLIVSADGAAYPKAIAWDSRFSSGHYGLLVVANAGGGNYDLAWELIGSPAQAKVNGPVHSSSASSTTVFRIGWGAISVPAGAPVVSYDVQYHINGGGDWRSLRTGTTGRSTYVTGRPGHTYWFRARTHDSLGRVGQWSTPRRVIVPYDDRAAAAIAGFLGAYSNSRSDFYLGTMRYSDRAGDRLSFGFKGGRVAIIGSKGPGRSKAKIFLDGKLMTTIDTNASTKRLRTVLYARELRGGGAHRVEIENEATAGRTRLEVDGFGIANYW